MWALVVAVIYFGSFLAIGFIAKVVLAKLMERTGADLSDVQAQARFLLGVWRDEE